ncbi:MAG TPA: hypothetical protein VNE62_04305 [Actinomycetota bacterium]|nr:hypothetical protein [Actinomycetota bacterium]
MLIDRHLPQWDFEERHEVRVRADRQRTWEAVLTTEFGSSFVSRLLVTLRGMRGTGSMRLLDFTRWGFVVLDEHPGAEIVLGLVGRFWTPGGGVIRIDPDEFASFDRPGYAKAVWNFSVEPEGDGCVVRTVTRVRATDASSKKRFRAYWTVIRPFSGFLRGRMLQAIRTGAEQG